MLRSCGRKQLVIRWLCGNQEAAAGAELNKHDGFGKTMIVYRVKLF